MTEIKIKIKYSKGEIKIKELTILNDMTIEDLRIIIEEEFQIPTYKQNLIYKGKMLKNEKKLEDYNISNNDVILLIEKVGEIGNKVGLGSVSGQSGRGVPGQINYDLLKHPIGPPGPGDLNQIIEALKIPEIAGQVDSFFDDPNVINAFLQNPQIKAMCDMNPMFKNLITNKEFMKNMLQPENLERMKRIQDGNANLSDLVGNLNLGGLNNINNTNYTNDINNTNNTTNTNNSNFSPFGNMGMFPFPMGNPLMNPLNPFMFGQNNLFRQGNGPNNSTGGETTEQLKERYKEKIAQIKDMGFDNEENIINALKKTNGNVDAAIERLISRLK